jgi:hypothetical protein
MVSGLYTTASELGELTNGRSRMRGDARRGEASQRAQTMCPRFGAAAQRGPHGMTPRSHRELGMYLNLQRIRGSLPTDPDSTIIRPRQSGAVAWSR